MPVSTDAPGICTPGRLDATLARQFAWLLRKDLREVFKTPSNPDFEHWWLVKGRQEFPGWAHTVPEQDLTNLFATSGKALVGGVLVDVPQVVKTLTRMRPDAVKELSSDGKLDSERFFAWAMVRGLAEHHLAEHAPRTLVVMLDQSVPGTIDGEVPAATLLMYLLWSLMDKPTQQHRNIFTPTGRSAYLPWFFSVVEKLGLAPLVAGRWRSWVKTQPGYKGAQLDWAQQSAAQMPPPPTPKESKPFGVNLYGFAYGELGIGEDLRMAVACCEAANIPYHVVNVDAGHIRQADRLLEGKTHDLQGAQLPPYRINIFCMPAFDTVRRVFMQKGTSAFEGYHNIGWWPWELAVFPKAWKPYAFELVDEVWASSQFLYDMYKQATDKPVQLVPLAVSVGRIKHYPRKHYGLAEKKFLFLYIFDFNSAVARKNPMAAAQAFKKAFTPSDDAVGLVLKTMNANASNPEWQAFIEECQTDERIKLITVTLDRAEVLGLINVSDAYLSLHRAEGFGRTLAEAMLLGKPVLATNYSGNVDFMNTGGCYPIDYELTPVHEFDYHWMEDVDEAVWANVSIVDSVKSMKKCYQARKGNVTHNNLSNFSIEAISKVVRRNLTNL